MTPAPHKPVSPSERVELLDVLRGFALFGVLVSNIVQVATDRFVVPPETLKQLATADVDAVVTSAFKLLVYGKFITIFGLLFGLGFAVQGQRAAARGTTAVPVYLRRLGWLLLFGLTHLVLLWWGDILHDYALAGLLLLLLHRRGDKTLLALGVGFALLPFAVIRVVSRLLSPSAPSEPATETPDLLSSLLSGNYFEVQVANLSLYTSHITVWLGLGLVLHSLGYFLLGYLLGRRRILHDVGRHRAALRRAAAWGLAVGLPLNVFYVGSGKLWPLPAGLPWRPLASLSFAVGFIALSTAYVAAVALLFQSPRWRRRLLWLAPVGRMALTNYLAQSLVYLLAFTGVGLGLYGKVGASVAVAVALFVFALQIASSRWWLERFRFGPAEWLWRSLTYGKPQPHRAR